MERREEISYIDNEILYKYAILWEISMKENYKTNKVKILLIDHDKNMQYFMKKLMQQENYKVYVANTGKEGLEQSTSLCPDMVLLEMKLLDMDGMEIIKEIRKWSTCPILVVSEDTNYKNKVTAFYSGADDYILKPFHEEEMRARIYSSLRRRVDIGTMYPYQAKDLNVDFNKRRVTVGEKMIHLPPVEYRILEYLAMNAGKVITYKMLLEKIWGPYTTYDTRNLRVNITSIRHKIEKEPTSPKYIFTEPRVGYRMLENGSIL